MKNNLAYIFVLLSFATQTIIAQTAFKTTVSKNKLGVNQRFKIIFSIII